LLTDAQARVATEHGLTHQRFVRSGLDGPPAMMCTSGRSSKTFAPHAAHLQRGDAALIDQARSIRCATDSSVIMT